MVKCKHLWRVMQTHDENYDDDENYYFIFTDSDANENMDGIFGQIIYIIFFACDYSILQLYFLTTIFFSSLSGIYILRYIHVFTMIMFCFIALSLLRAWEYLTLDFLISFLNKRYCHLITTNIDSQSFFFYSATVQYCNIKFKYFILIINSFMTEADIIQKPVQ